jgi:ribosome-associated protein
LDGPLVIDLMEEMLPINDKFSIPAHELWFTASRAGGPGGQHVNTTSSRITLHWDVTNTGAFDHVTRERLIARLHNRLNRDGILCLNVEDERSQHRNREIARQRLKDLVVEALKKPKRRIPTTAGAGAKRRRLDEKKHRSAVKRLRSKPGHES